MNEAQARAWLDVPRETLDRLDTFLAELRAENGRQNLVSSASLDQVWTRHIVDSAQLPRLVSTSAQNWLDLGTGAGFPGLIVALLFPGQVALVESRRLRVEFLRRAADILGVTERVSILCAKVENIPAAKFDVISARAFAPLDRLFTLGERFAAPKTRWVLPKGKNAKSELEAAESLWQGSFRLEPSVTDAEAQIVVAEQVRRKSRGRRSQ